jgi:hypothetical protein
LCLFLNIEHRKPEPSWWAQAANILLSVKQFPVSKLAGYGIFDTGFSWFYSVFPENCWDGALNKAIEFFFHIRINFQSCGLWLNDKALYCKLTYIILHIKLNVILLCTLVWSWLNVPVEDYQNIYAVASIKRHRIWSEAYRISNAEFASLIVITYFEKGLFFLVSNHDFQITLTQLQFVTLLFQDWREEQTLKYLLHIYFKNIFILLSLKRGNL